MTWASGDPKLDRVREIAVQSAHEGEQDNALRQAVRMQGSTLAFERMIRELEQRARTYEAMAREFPDSAAGLTTMADRERDIIRRSFAANGR